MTDETMALLKEAQKQDVINKAYTVSTGLINYDLQKPANTLYPVTTPLRNSIPRVMGQGGTATHWRAITSINSASLNPVLEEGKRGGVSTDVVKSYTATYAGLGIEQSVTFEAQFASEKFDDARARAVEGALRSLMIAEEKMLIGGNATISLGKPGAIVTTTASTGGLILDAADIVVSAIPLSYEAYVVNGFTVASGLSPVITRTNGDAATSTIYGGTGIMSDAVTQTVGSTGSNTNSVTAVVPVCTGAVAYAWYWGPTSGAGQLIGAITTVNTYTITASVGTGTQAANAANLSTEHGYNSLGFDGLISIACGAGQEDSASTSGAQVVDLLHAALTSDGAGGIVEIDAALEDRWNNYQLGVDELYVNAQQLKSIDLAVLNATGSPLIRFSDDIGGASNKISGGSMVYQYLNKYTMNGGQMIKIVLHPYVPAGTMIGITRNIPYPLSNVSNPMEVELRRDYYQIEYPLRTRKYEFGVYCDEVLMHKFPPALTVWTNIASS